MTSSKNLHLRLEELCAFMIREGSQRRVGSYTATLRD